MLMKVNHDTGGMRYALGVGVLQALPIHANLVGQIAADWATIESIFAGCLATMMKADLEPSIALLKRFGTATARAQAAREIAKASLSESERINFIQIVGEFEALAKRRNSVVHAVWAVSDDHPGELLRMSDAIFATFPLLAIRSQLLDEPIEGEINKLEATIVPVSELEVLIADLKAFSAKITPLLTEGAKAFALREIQAGRIAEGVTLTGKPE